MALHIFVLFLLSFLRFGSCQYDRPKIELDPTKRHEEFFTFYSRPDIDAPRWNHKVYNKAALAPGYWFVAPYILAAHQDNTAAYVGPAIYDSKNGELVWNGGAAAHFADSHSFQAVKFNGNPMLSFLQPLESHGVIMDNHYQIKRHVRTSIFGKRQNMHDFQIVDDSTKALYLTKDKIVVTRDESLTIGVDDECLVEYNGFEERLIDTDEILFRWSAEDHISLSESYLYPSLDPKIDLTNLCKQGRGLDHMHANSIEKLPDGDYLMSCRHTHAIYKISHMDGSIVWRLGGKKSDFTFGEGVHFSGQHDARCLSQNETHVVISMMDNAVGYYEGFHSNPNSRALVLSVNTELMTAVELRHYDHPGGKGAYSIERGNAQTLPNGNMFASWTDNNHHSEYSPTGELVAEASLLAGLKTYRSFKFPWVGNASSTKPAVYSHVVSDGADDKLRTVVYVSWNGDTHARKWSLYQTDSTGTEKELLNTTRRVGFETMLSYKGYVPFVKVDAVDLHGKHLVKSPSEAIETIVHHHEQASGALVIQEKSPQRVSRYTIVAFLVGLLLGSLALRSIRQIRRVLERSRNRGLYAALADMDRERGPLYKDKPFHEFGESTPLEIHTSHN